MLRARANDPNYALVSIPQLNAELINEEISGFYVDWLEEVHRQEALKTTMQRIGPDAAQAAGRDAGLDDEGNSELGRRKAAILETLNKRKK